MHWKRLIPQAALILATAACTLPLPGRLAATTTPTQTPSPSLTPTPTATPTPTPTPTPLPAVRVASGDRALDEGDYDRAQDEYQVAFSSSPDEEVRAAAQLGLGRVKYLTGDLPGALEALRAVTEGYPHSSHRAAAYYFLGKTLDALKRYDEAAIAYTSYLELDPGVIDSFVQARRADALVAAGEYARAADAYQAAAAAPHLGSSEALEISAARAIANSGDDRSALDKYQLIFDASTNDYTKAQLDLLMGRSLLNLGEAEAAYERFQDAVTNYPRSYDSYSALVALVDAGVAVSELNRGLVDYFAGQYTPAVEAFNRYIQATPVHDATAHYYMALAQVNLSHYDDALAQLDHIISEHRADRFWVDAWDEKAFIQWAYLGQFDAAAQTLLAYVALVPQDAQAPANLFEAARIFERNQQLDQAAKTWERLADDYPSADQTQRGLLLAGVTRYRMGTIDEAQRIFQRALLLATSPADQAAALLWIGKTQLAGGDAASAKATWTNAMDRDPTGYYSERARDLVLGQAPFPPSPGFDLGYDLVAERAAAAEWVRSQFNLTPDIDLNSLGALASDPRLRRGIELWNLGEYDAARVELEDLRQAVASDPADTFRLVGTFVDLGLYRSAIFAARQVLTLAGMDDAATLNAPIYFNHIRFGTYYQDMVLPEARARDVDPLFLYSVIRQESLFEGFVRSSAGARGLMQIIPATGQDIAANLAWPPGYTDGDLYRPFVSLRLGTAYLAQQRAYFDGDLYAALAAYNAGPGNAGAWEKIAGDDPDLFLETVRIQETRTYIMNIYEIYTIYRRLYYRAP